VFKHKYVKTAMVMLLAVMMGFFAVYVHALTVEDLTDTPLPSFNVLNDFVNSNRYTQMDEAAPAVNQQALITTNKAISTALGTVYIDESALSFSLRPVIITSGHQPLIATRSMKMIRQLPKMRQSTT
jgi:hypothetical protein